MNFRQTLAGLLEPQLKKITTENGYDFNVDVVERGWRVVSGNVIQKDKVNIGYIYDVEDIRYPDESASQGKHSLLVLFGFVYKTEGGEKAFDSNESLLRNFSKWLRADDPEIAEENLFDGTTLPNADGIFIKTVHPYAEKEGGIIISYVTVEFRYNEY